MVLGALIFGGAEALQLRVQQIGLEIPREFVVMLPYVLILAALAGFGRKSQPPAQTLPSLHEGKLIAEI